jgi:hypothetical protein
MIPLDDQNRALWEHSLIAEGCALVEKALRQKRPGPYQIQAAIAAVHSESASAEDTDWAQIAELYRVLERYQPSPVVTLNRAVAMAKIQGAKEGIALLRTIENAPEIRRYYYFDAALAALLAEDNQLCGAVAAYERALLLTQNPGERAFIRRKISGLKPLTPSIVGGRKECERLVSSRASHSIECEKTIIGGDEHGGHTQVIEPSSGLNRHGHGFSRINQIAGRGRSRRSLNILYLRQAQEQIR